MRALSFVYLSRCGAIVAAVFAVGVAASANAATVFSDDFSPYPNGNLSVVAPSLPTNIPDIGTGWLATAAAATPIQVASNAAVLGLSGQDDYAGFSVVVNAASGSITTSMDINVSSATATGDYFAHLSSPLGTTSNFYQRTFIRSSVGFQLGMLDTSGGTMTFGTTVLSFNAVHKISTTWAFVPGALNDTFTMTADSLPYLTHAWASGTAEPANLAAFNLRQGGATTSAALTVDNVVVSSIPEPATLGLAALSLMGLVAARRRRA